MKLNRSIGHFSLLLTAVGGIVGSGWLFGPFYASQAAGPAAILAWIIGGVLVMIIALTFAELATMFPVAGSMIRFTQISHGPLVSFALAWISWLAAINVAPIETIAILQYASNYLPWLVHKTGDTHSLTLIGGIVAAIVMFLMCILSSLSTKNISRANAIIVLIKLIVPIATIFILLTSQFKTQVFSSYGGFAPYGIKGVLAALSTSGVVFSFIGFNPAIQLAGEARNPSKAIPFAVIGGMVLCILLYALVQTVFIGAVNPQNLAQGWKHISFVGDAGPIAGIVSGFGLIWFVKILYLDAVVSPLGTAYIYTVSTGRINYGMSRNGYMPKIFEKLTRKGVPLTGIMTNFVVGMLFLYLFPGWQIIAGFIMVCFILSYAIGPIALLALRRKMPNIERPFRLPLPKFFSFMAFYICNLLLFWSGWNMVWRMLVAIAVGYIFLIIYRYFQAKKQIVEKLGWPNIFWLFPYFIGLGIISYFGSFGNGKNLISFGWDFAVIAIFSIIILYFAVYKCKSTEQVEKYEQIN